MKRPRTDIRKEAADWVIALQEEGAGAGELGRFRAWLLQSPAHVAAYLKAEAVWLALRQVDSERKVDIDALLLSTSNVVPLRPEVTTTPREHPLSEVAVARNIGRWRAAAVLLVAFVGLLIWAVRAPEVRLETALGEQRTSVMEDGSVIEINTQSVVRVGYTEGMRNVRLVSGEAFFIVRKDSSRPFVVSIDDYDVTAVGTEFNIYRRSTETVVTVEEGVVEIVGRNPGPEQPVRMKAGQQAVISGNAITLSADPNALDRAIAWRRNQLVSLGDPLQDVIDEINRYNQRKLILKDEALTSRRVSGVFSVHNPELIVRFLERSAAMRVASAADGSWLLYEGARSAGE